MRPFTAGLPPRRFLFRLVSEALQIGPQLLRKRKVPSIEALDLIDRGAGVLRQREDVDLPPGVDEPLAYGGVP